MSTERRTIKLERAYSWRCACGRVQHELAVPSKTERVVFAPKTVKCRSCKKEFPAEAPP